MYTCTEWRNSTIRYDIVDLRALKSWRDGQLNLAHSPETKNNEKIKNKKPSSLDETVQASNWWLYSVVRCGIPPHSGRWWMQCFCMFVRSDFCPASSVLSSASDLLSDSSDSEVFDESSSFTLSESDVWNTLRLVAWHSGRTSVFGRRTFPVLRSTC